MINSVDAENRIKSLRSGESDFILVGGQNRQVVFLVRESSAVIKYFGTTAVEVRAGLFPIGPVAVVAVAFRVGQYYGREYATWWNYHHPEGKENFRAMATQDFLSFHFYGDHGRKDRTFISANPLTEFFNLSIDAIHELPPWQENDFFDARLTILSSFPTARQLWDNLPPAA